MEKDLIDAAQFADQVNAAIAGAFPGKTSHRYTAVRVLMIRWEVDELGVENDCKELEHVLANKFKFDVESILLPPQKAQQQLLWKIANLIMEFAHRDTLFIVHYSGHGSVTSKNDAIWRW
jgi:Caspase domain